MDASDKPFDSVYPPGSEVVLSAQDKIEPDALLSRLHLRDAVPEDATAISLILAEAFTSLYCWTFGPMETPKVAQLLEALYHAGCLSLTTTRVAVLEGDVCGVLILHVGQSIGKGTLRNFLRVVSRERGLIHSTRAFFGGIGVNFLLNARIPRAEDLLYIEALAVDATHRGMGIGTSLLNDAFLWASKNHRSRIALHVLQRNTEARRLYERLGFQLCSSERLHEPQRKRQQWVSLLMMRHIP